MRSTVMLRTGVALFAVATATVAEAQTSTPPPEAAQTSADQTEPSPEGIVITGSRIRRDPLNQDSPVVFLDKAEIDKTGLTAAGDVLQRLPSAAGGLNTKMNNSGNVGSPPDGGGVGAGASEIDLRYLGAKRTLVLVDGLRFVNGTSASGIPANVDLNAIPTNMIERIEVLQAGASPLYGSDAIAGVVNVITVSKQRGLRMSAQYGQFLKYDDGETFNADISGGFGDDRTDIVVGANYVKQKPVYSRDRSISQFPNPGLTACDTSCSSATAGGRFDLRTDANFGTPLFGNFTIANFPDFTPTFGELRGWQSPADRFNFAPYQYILTPSERAGVWGSFKREVTDHLNFRMKIQYQNRLSENKAAFLPLFIGPDAGNGAGSLFDTMSIDATNPYNPFGITLESGLNPDGSLNGKPATFSTVRRRVIEAGQRDFHQEVDTWLGTVTVDGDFNLFGGHAWYWDVNAVWGNNHAKQSFTGNLRADRVGIALGPLAVCQATPGCVPLNIFGGNGSITQEMLDYIAFTERDKSNQKLADYTANLSGAITDLPAGPLDLAVGYEHRYQSAYYIPDPIISAGLGADVPSQPARGKYNVDEVYGELRVPIVKDAPFAYELTATGAVRHSSYSTSGSATTYTVNGVYKPIHDLLLRGAYTTGFRAPSLGELYGGKARFDQFLADPCSNIPGSLASTNPVAKANCLAQGVPSSYAEDPAQWPVLTQGNENLKPEKSKNFTIGTVYSPAWARGNGGALSVELDYHHITVDKAIGAFDAGLLLETCALTNDPLTCSKIKRTVNGFISEINSQLFNLDSIKTSGVDANLTYRTPQTGFGRGGLTVNVARLLKYKYVASGGFLEIDRLGTERGSPNQAYPKWKWNATLDWGVGNFNGSITERFLSKVTEFDQGNGVFRKLNNRFYTDIQLNYDLPLMGQRFQLTGGVNNLFDKDPPPCFSCDGNNFDATSYDAPGRFGYLRIAYKM